MESGSAVVGREERKKKYHIYVEEYVLSYLRREADSLELSEIYFYGSRQENGRKLYVYGAGRDKEIPAFAAYEPIPELVCRLTQAGPVFLVREPDGECRTTGFQIFYDNNEAMQNYLLEWTGSAGKKRMAEKSDEQERLSVPALFPKEEKKRTAHGAMSVQLCLILVVLVAIVITSTDSYDKMEELNRSAKEVFFAIENQEAGETVQDADADGAEDLARESAGDKEILIERETGAPGKEQQGDEATKEPEADGRAEERMEDGDSGETEKESAQDTDPGEKPPAGEEGQTEGVLKSVQGNSGETGDQNFGQESGSDKAEDADDTQQKEQVSSDVAGDEKEEENEPEEQSEEENEEALSRSITRYYEVEQGDTLYTISQKIYGNNSRVEKICELNQISDPDKIRSGQRIILP